MSVTANPQVLHVSVTALSDMNFLSDWKAQKKKKKKDNKGNQFCKLISNH